MSKKSLELEVAGERSAGSRTRTISLALLLVGVLILLYPIGATMWNDYRAQEISHKYEDDVSRIQPSSLIEEMFVDAEGYNSWLSSVGHPPMPEDPDVPEFQDYMSQLNAPSTNGVMARVVVPSIGVDLPVYHGTSDEVLYRGAGHMYGTDLPIGGEGRTSVITAHTGMVNASMFDNLWDLDDDGDIYVSILGKVLHYKVTEREVVKPEDYDAVTYEESIDKLILLTCTPYGINSDRLLVTAERVVDSPMETAQVQADSWFQISWWMKLVLILVAVLISTVLWAVFKKQK